jgi:hypothetical protein
MFSKIMGEMNLVPFLGDKFNVYFPIVIILLCAITALNAYGRILKLFRVKRFIFEDEDGDASDEEGQSAGKVLLQKGTCSILSFLFAGIWFFPNQLISWFCACAAREQEENGGLEQSGSSLLSGANDEANIESVSISFREFRFRETRPAEQFHFLPFMNHPGKRAADRISCSSPNRGRKGCISQCGKPSGEKHPAKQQAEGEPLRSRRHQWSVCTFSNLFFFPCCEFLLTKLVQYEFQVAALALRQETAIAKPSGQAHCGAGVAARKTRNG